MTRSQSGSCNGVGKGEMWPAIVVGSCLGQSMKSGSEETPPGYGNIRTEQLIRADRELFTILSQEHIGSLKPNAAGVSPLDDRVRALITDPRITMFMLPLPTSQKAIKEGIDRTPKADSPPEPRKVKKAKKARVEKSCPEDLKKYKMNCTHGKI